MKPEIPTNKEYRCEKCNHVLTGASYTLDDILVCEECYEHEKVESGELTTKQEDDMLEAGRESNLK